MEGNKKLNSLLKENRIEKVESIYYKNNHIDVLLKSSNSVTELTVDALIKAVVKILNYKDAELDRGNKEQKLFRKSNKKYSDEIRKASLESLAALYNYADLFKKCDTFSIRKKIEKALSEVYDANSNDWQFWETNKKILPILASIDSNNYVAQIAHIIKNTEIVEKLLSIDSDNIFFTENPLSYIANSLRNASYDNGAFSSCIDCLLTIIEKDYQTKDNYAISTIKTIINPYSPLTKYPEEKIPLVFSACLKKHKKIAFRVLRELQYSRLNTYIKIEPPKYIKLEDKNTNSNEVNKGFANHFIIYAKEYIRYASKYLDVLQIIEDAPNLIPQVADELREKLHNSCKKYANNSSKRSEMWQKMFLVLPKIGVKEIADIIAEVMKNIEPNDEIEKSLILFDNSEIDLMDRKIKDYSKQEEEISNKRINALEKIYKSKGKAGIEELVERTKNASRVAFCLAKSSQSGLFEKDIEKALSDTGSQKKKEFIEAYIWYMFILNNKIKWLSRINYEDFNQSAIKKLLLLVQSNKDIWQIVQERKIDEYYWQKIKIDAYGSWTENELEYIIKKLNEHKRQSLSINFIAIAIYRKKTVDSQLIFDTLSGFDGDPSEEYREALNIETVLEYYQITEKDESKLIAIELKYINYFPKYQNKLRPTHLIKALSQKPELFCMVYDQVFSERKDNYAFYKIVHDYYIQPGLDANNKRTKKSVDDWVNAVENYYSANKDRLKCAKSTIGQNMATNNCYKPQDDEAILKFLNNCDEDYRRGFMIGVANSRGVMHVDEKCTEDNKLIDIWEKAAQRLDEKGLIGTASLFRRTEEDFRINIKHTKDMLRRERIS